MSSLSQSASSWKEILINGYKNNQIKVSEQVGHALVNMSREIHKILLVNYQKKGLFNKSIQSSFSGQSLAECIGKVFSTRDDKFADYIGQLMSQMEMIEFEGQLSQEKKKIHFLHPYLPRLVILGGGHSGITTANHLHEYFSIVLIDKNDNCSLKPGFPAAVENIENISKISVKFSEALPSKVTFIQGLAKVVREDCVFIDLIGREPQVKYLFGTNSETSDNIKNCKYLPFDYLVVSSGSNAWKNLPSYDASNGDNKIYFVDTYQMEMLQNGLNILSQNSDTQSIVIIGGGMVGCEFFGSLTQTFPNKKVYLVQRSELLMNPSNDAHKVAMDTFGKFKNGHVMLNSQVVHQLDSNTLVIKSKTGEETHVKCSVCFLASGTSPNTSMMKDHFGTSLDESGFLKVNSSFQLYKSPSEFYHNIFVLGDANNADPEKLMQNANYHALKFVEIAKSIIKLDGKELPIYESAARVMAVSLGPKYGFMTKENKVMFKSSIINKMKGMIQSTTVKGYSKQSKK